jgi:ketosteroid isomerase-like protein
MKKITAFVLFACVCAGLLFAYSSKARSGDLSDADTVMQLERDWADAAHKDFNTRRISQILADDWRSVGGTGNIFTKESYLSYVQSGKSPRFESFEFGPADVKVLRNIAVVQGSGTATMNRDGQESILRAAWMDVFEKRGDRWVIVRSQSVKLN